MDSDVEMQVIPDLSATHGVNRQSSADGGRGVPGSRAADSERRGHASKPSSSTSSSAKHADDSNDHIMADGDGSFEEEAAAEESWAEEDDQIDALPSAQVHAVIAVDPDATESEDEEEEQQPAQGESSHDEGEGDRSEHDDNAAEAESDSGSEDDEDSDDGAEHEDIVVTAAAEGAETEGGAPMDVVEPITLPTVEVPAAVVENAAPVAGPSTLPVKKPVKRRRSPSPTPPPPPAPLKTIRLNLPIRLPDMEEYAVIDIAALARSTGQIPTTPPRVVKPPVESSDTEKDEEGKKKKIKRRRRTGAAGDVYDVHDPFIDDSELAQDERTTFAQTKQQGFYVSSGEIALLKGEKTPRKPKSRKITAQLGESSSGTRDDPHALSDSEDKRKKYTTVVENGKKRKVMEINAFHPDLQPDLEKLQAAIAAENWENKSKFPPDLKPILHDVAVKAVRLDEYDDDFFVLMTSLFPYNRFTMMKLTKRLIFTDHLAILYERQDVLLADLTKVATDGFERAKDELQKAQALWEEKMAKVEEATSAPVSVSAAGTADTAPGADVHEDGGDGVVGGAKSKLPPKPVQRYRMTDEMKAILWKLVMISNECCRLENERNQLEGSTATVSEQGSRKILYQKILAAYPVDWMSTGQISREVSMMKKRYEKAAGE